MTNCATLKATAANCALFAFSALKLRPSQYHRFKRWFGISPIRAVYVGRLKAVFKALLAISA